jgi:hypothetical protein
MLGGTKADPKAELRNTKHITEHKDDLNYLINKVLRSSRETVRP